MSTLHLLSYNNYYNRIVKMESSLAAYQGYQVKYNGRATDPNGNTAIIEGVNFVDGDFVDTTQVVNWQGDLPNYVLVVDDNVIKSRWFVVASEKTRGGQLLLELHRDLVVDYYGNLMNDRTSIFVEKATIPSSNDLIFNRENMSYNQIKKSELLLKDDTQCPWIVLYGARKNGEGAATTFTSTFTPEYPVITLTDAEYNEIILNPNTKVSTDVNARVTISLIPDGKDEGIIIEEDKEPYLSPVPIGESGGARNFIPEPLNFLQPIYKNVLASVKSTIPAYGPNVNRTLYQYLYSRQNAYFKWVDKLNVAHYYELRIHQAYVDIEGGPSTYEGALGQALAPLKNIFTEPNQVTLDDWGNIGVTYWLPTLEYGFYEIPAPGAAQANTITISADRYHLSDAPYDMFCLPLSDTLYIKGPDDGSPSRGLKSNRYLNLSLANQLISDYAGVGQIYDAQILPFCPIATRVVENDNGYLIYNINDINPASYSYIRNGEGTRIGYLLHATKSSFAFEIPLTNPIIITDYKVQSECDLYRLNSPNYAAVFEFNAAKNGGVTTFNIKCTYKPFSPYIKVYPNFGRLYGNDYNDARGLICSGDFSLPMLTDQWKTYELSNKNYQASFDRQIQNLEINNAVQREYEAWSVAAGAVGAGVTGAGAGMLLGGPVGAVVGGLISAGTSAAAGARDRELNERLRMEAIDYAKDQFGYQLGNIKALPQTLSRTSAYNIDNKYFPFLEYFTCSNVEKQALRDKIKFNGMTVMAIGTMKYYKENYQGEDPMYFKGKLIRLDGFTGDYHIFNAIASEIYKGVFI